MQFSLCNTKRDFKHYLCESVLVSVRFEFSSLLMHTNERIYVQSAFLCGFRLFLGCNHGKTTYSLHFYFWCHLSFFIKSLLSLCFGIIVFEIFSFSFTSYLLIIFAMRFLLLNKIGKLCDFIWMKHQIECKYRVWNVN